MKNKKGNAYVIGIIVAFLAVVLFTAIVPGQVNLMRSLQADTDSIAHTGAGGPTHTSHTLEYASFDPQALSIAGLTLTNNYTVDYNTGIVTILNTTANATYTASYSYEASNYLDSAGEIALAGIIMLAFIIGIFYLVLKVSGAV